MSKRKYVKKEKPIEVTEIKLSDFNKDLLFLTKIKPPKKEPK
jgi:hypothetical protein